AEVALNGKQSIIRDYSPEINQNLTIRCFQPEKGHCACFFINIKKATASRHRLIICFLLEIS
ncbi:hypothetical protein, partial [Roseburia faecis]|uniref:hypothetical protein n=1 Tax=Roseburia faecis TaxID=301302 RepID=UPI002ED45376